MHPDYSYRAVLAVACEGPADGRVRGGPLGLRRSRDGAKLEHARADAQFWYAPSEAGHHLLLTNPTRREVAGAFDDCCSFLEQYANRQSWYGGTISFCFAGHAKDDGDLVLADGVVSAEELM